MTRDVQLILSPKEAANELLMRMKVSDSIGIDINRINRIDIIKKSVDARQRTIKINMTLRAHIDDVDATSILNSFCGLKYTPLSPDAPQAIVVGAGPAGLFAALQLIEDGVKPIVLERGKTVDERRKDIALIAKEQTVNPDSNYCFGEGGAGTFSDGKLYTRSKKRGNNDKVLAILHDHGAQPSILYEAHPHIGTDVLSEVIKNIRNTILENGGEIHFNTRVSNLLLLQGKDSTTAQGVETADGRTFYGPVILATGHSARDTYRMLHSKGVDLEAKGLAIGVRLEHPQQLIDQLQYHTPDGRGKYLPAAEYSFLTRVENRGVYSFCMCPGGVIVPSASAPEQSAVNGMSSSARGSRWANAGMVVELLPEDVEGSSPLKMLEYQENIERRFYDAAGRTQKAPAQRMTDFVDAKPSLSVEESSYAPGLFTARVDQLLPELISSRLRSGFREFGKKKKGFLTPKATVIGAETRTSSPIRIPRDTDTRQHPVIGNLYPVGEGAGWAGGIVSSAIDGQNSAHALAAKLHHDGLLSAGGSK